MTAQRAGQFVHFAGLTRFFRLQSGGMSGLNIPSEQVREVGQDLSIERVFDNPDATFEFESWDMTTSMERMFLRLPGEPADGEEINFANLVPIDIIVPWRQRRTGSTVRGGTVFPYVYLEQMSYRFGVQQNAGQTATARGDAAYFVPGGTPRYQEFSKSGTGPYSFDDTAIKTVEDGVDVYALCVTIYEPTNPDTTYRRLRAGSDYTENASGITLSSDVNSEFGNGTSTIAVSYGTAVQDTLDESDLPDPEVKPSAYKGRDIDLYVSDGAATPQMARIRGVQSLEASWRVNYDLDYELGTRYAVARDYDVPEVSGNIVVRPDSGKYLIDLIAQFSGNDPTEVQNVISNIPVELEARIYHPKHHSQLQKTLYCPDARITAPATPVRAGQKSDFTFPWTSDSGTLLVFNGARP